MALIKPFVCLRTSPEMAATVAALPYDVYSRAEACKVVAGNPKSFLAIDRAETQFGCEVDTYDERVYKKASEMLQQWKADGIFITDKEKVYYIYEQTMSGRTQTGIVAVASIDDYLNGVIKKHENTRADKELDRINHVNVCSAQTGPIFLAYRNNTVITDVVNQTKRNAPIYDFTSEDGIRHRVFRINDMEANRTLEEAFMGISEIYIADGHHRAASAVKVGLMRREAKPDFDGSEEFNYFLSVLFPDDELMIMDYNRVLRNLNGYSEKEFLGIMREKFDVCEIAVDKEDQGRIKPEKKGCFSMYLGKRWYSCKVRKEDMCDDPVKGLDVSLLQDLLLNPILGITDPKTDHNIDFVGGIRGLKELERRCEDDCVCAFAMYPTSIGELFAVADAGLLMPPKSTWFEPKLRSGLFIHEF